MMGVTIVIALVGVALYYVARPLVGGARAETTEPSQLISEADERKHAAILAILELEEENQTGKLSDGDLVALRSQYESAALQALRELEELGAEARVEDEFEAEIERLKEQMRCPKCGATRPANQTCPSCGS
jgi:rubrerythrin